MQQAQEIDAFLAKLRCSLHLRAEALPSSSLAVTSYSDKIESRWLPLYCKHNSIMQVRHLTNSLNPSSYSVEHPRHTTFFPTLLTLNFAQASALTEACGSYFFSPRNKWGILYKTTRPPNLFCYHFLCSLRRKSYSLSKMYWLVFCLISKKEYEVITIHHLKPDLMQLNSCVQMITLNAVISLLRTNSIRCINWADCWSCGRGSFKLKAICCTLIFFLNADVVV